MFSNRVEKVSQRCFVINKAWPIFRTVYLFVAMGLQQKWRESENWITCVFSDLHSSKVCCCFGRSNEKIVTSLFSDLYSKWCDSERPWAVLFCLTVNKIDCRKESTYGKQINSKRKHQATTVNHVFQLLEAARNLEKREQRRHFSFTLTYFALYLSMA